MFIYTVDDGSNKLGFHGGGRAAELHPMRSVDAGIEHETMGSTGLTFLVGHWRTWQK